MYLVICSYFYVTFCSCDPAFRLTLVSSSVVQCKSRVFNEHKAVLHVMLVGALELVQYHHWVSPDSVLPPSSRAGYCSVLVTLRRIMRQSVNACDLYVPLDGRVGGSRSHHDADNLQ